MRTALACFLLVLGGCRQEPSARPGDGGRLSVADIAASIERDFTERCLSSGDFETISTLAISAGWLEVEGSSELGRLFLSPSQALTWMGLQSTDGAQACNITYLDGDGEQIARLLAERLRSRGARALAEDSGARSDLDACLWFTSNGREVGACSRKIQPHGVTSQLKVRLSPSGHF